MNSVDKKKSKFSAQQKESEESEQKIGSLLESTGKVMDCISDQTTKISCHKKKLIDIVLNQCLNSKQKRDQIVPHLLQFKQIDFACNSNKYKNSKDVSQIAVKAEHLEILKWARENGCPWDENRSYGLPEEGESFEAFFKKVKISTEKTTSFSEIEILNEVGTLIRMITAPVVEYADILQKIKKIIMDIQIDDDTAILEIQKLLI